jgi:hypothetical protein
MVRHRNRPRIRAPPPPGPWNPGISATPTSPPSSDGRMDLLYLLGQLPEVVVNLSTYRPRSNLGATNKMSTITTTALQTSYPPILPKSFNGNQPKTIRLYPLSNYTFGTKETQPEEDPSVLARLKRLEEHYVEHGMRRTCEGILVCHEHNHPHILMLQIANAFFKLPGDYLKPEDDEIDGFKMRLNERLAPVGTQFSGEGVNEEWEIGDTLAQWWRPNFETFMYPFIPAHVTRPKECKKLYFIQLPRQSKLLFKFILSYIANFLCRGSKRPKEHEASRSPLIRALRQYCPLWTTIICNPSSPLKIQLRVR